MSDKTTVATIVGSLGIEIARAQKEFNKDFLDNIERLLMVAFKLFPEENADAPYDAKTVERIIDLIKELAPPRYQFTETKLNIKMDIAKSVDIAGSAGVSLGYGAIAVNAALTLGYGYDYRAAAECQTVIHGSPMDESLRTALMDRVKELKMPNDFKLPDTASVDNEVFSKLEKLWEVLQVKKPAAGAGGG